ncbi:MAG: diaminopimelate epimerase [Verrucomicrobia bacterium]|nr:diaminopimelate epimerase [Verrucomicrobiota bacterium]
MIFSKYHALGNDYLVIDPSQGSAELTPAEIVRICHRHFGIGSDGILLGPLPSTQADFGLRIFNPDGSEAEKSGNGIRIFSRYLFDTGRVGGEEFTLDTLGGRVRSTVSQQGREVRVEMGRVSFQSDLIPVAGPSREVLQESIPVQGRTFTFCAATVGNPHCVIPLPEVNESLARQYGPGLETHSLFPKRTNVQFLQILDRRNIRIEIWERGAGYTLASGSSSSASAAVAKKLGLVDEHVTVHMPGGQLLIEISPDYDILMTGPVTRVGHGELHPEIYT